MTDFAIDTRAGRLAGCDFGGGGPALLLWPSIFMDRESFKDAVAALSPTWRVITLDGPGHGQSGAPSPGINMADCGAAMLSVMDHFGIDQAVLGGTSWGGIAAAEAALQAPHRVTGLVLMNTPIAAGSRSFLHRFIVTGARHLIKFKFFRDGVAKSFFLDPKTAAPNFHSHLIAADPKALSMAVAAVLYDRRDLSQRLASLTMPTLFIAGAKDEMYALEAYETLSHKMAKGRLAVLPTRHISLTDAPVKTLDEVTRFLMNLDARAETKAAAS